MAHEITDQPPASTSTPDQTLDEIDPQAHLHLRMRVLGTYGKLLGKIDVLDRDATTGHLSALVIRHGIFKNKLTSVPANRVKWVNSDSVILDLTPLAFTTLPRLATN